MADSLAVPPHSIDAERAVLGSIFVDKDALIKISDFLSGGDFYHDTHRTIYDAILTLYDKRIPVDIVTLTNFLEDNNHLQLVGGASYLAELANEVPTATHIFQYASIVKQKSVLRKLIKAGDAIKGFGYKEEEELDGLIDRAEKALFSVSQEHIKDRFVHIKDVLNKTYEKISDLHDPEAKEKYRGIPTGFRDLDNILSGLQPSDLVVIAARPSMGKTALALNVAQNVAKRGFSVGLISLEMSKEQLVERMFCSLMGVDSWKMRTGRLSDDDFAKMGNVMDELNQMKIFIDDSVGGSIPELKAKARRLKMEMGLDVLVVDYLQLMSVTGTSKTYQQNRVQEISEISRALKELARDLSVPIVALSQLSRAVEMRPSKIPQLSDLRECVVGDTMATLSSGIRKPISSLVDQTPNVLALNKKRKFCFSESEKVWAIGKQPVYTVKLASGRELTATEGHRLFTIKGWQEVGRLSSGDSLAVARRVPEPECVVSLPEKRVALLGQLIGDGSYLKGQSMRYTTSSEENSEVVREAAVKEFRCKVKRYKGRRNWHQLLISGNGTRWRPKGVNKWLRDLDIFGQRSHEKRVPEIVFRLSNDQVALFLKHLWATDGTIYTRPKGKKGSHLISYSTNSRGLADDIAYLLLRFGIVARIRSAGKKGYRLGYAVNIVGAVDQKVFIDQIGAFGPRVGQAERLLFALGGIMPNTNVDVLPRRVFDRVRSLMKTKGITHRQMALLRGTSYGGSSHFSFSPSRALLSDYAEILDDDELRSYCSDDLFWDKVVSVIYTGIEDVYDLTVPGPASWLANGIVSHNSGAIEQDADVVLMMYREDYYEEDSDRPGVTDIYIRKHRNGPIGRVELSFKKEQMKFVSIEKERKAEEYGV